MKKTIKELKKDNQKLIECLEFYAGLSDDVVWEHNRLIGFDKFGGTDSFLCGPKYAQQVLSDIGNIDYYNSPELRHISKE